MRKLFIISALTCAALIGGCMTMDQGISAGVEAVGEAYGSAVLTKNTSPEYLANYKLLVPKVRHVMQGAMTPADFHILVIQMKASIKPDAKEAAALGFLSSINDSFVKYNGGSSPTPKGAMADAAAQQLATGLAKAVGLVTGTNWTPPADAAASP